MEVYYRQIEYRKRTGRYAASAKELGMPEADATDGVRITATADGYTAQTKAVGLDGKTEVLHIREDSLISRSAK
jgi:hypothetical protein